MSASSQQVENQPQLSAIVPCYNEQECIVETYKRLSKICAASAGESYEIVFVNDGSKDSTPDKLAQIATLDPRVVMIDLSRNYGHQIALSAGLEFSSGEKIFVIDADLQDPPELLPEMLEIMDDGYDVVYGQRQSRAGETGFKRLTASLFYRTLRKLSDVDIAANTGDFRLMSRRAVDHLNAMPERFRFVRGMVSWIGLNQIAFPYERQARFAGQTHYPLTKMLGLAIDAITSFSVVPLRFASHIGMLCGLVGIAMLTYTIGAWVTGNSVQGWTSLASIVLILGSTQLLVLGIFGEYLGRMYIESKQRPLFIVKQIHGAPAKPIKEPQPADVASTPIRKAANG